MCWRIDTPKVDNKYKVNDVTGADILPSTTSETPEAPVFGGSEDTFGKTKGKASLKIKPDTTIQNYNPVNY